MVNFVIILCDELCESVLAFGNPYFLDSLAVGRHGAGVMVEVDQAFAKAVVVVADGAISVMIGCEYCACAIGRIGWQKIES
jgi:hypothetical protein